MPTQSSPGPSHAAAEVLLRATVCAASRIAWDVTIRGQEWLPEGPCFLYGNHSNNYDPFILNRFTEWGEATTGVMTMEFAGRGLVGSIFRATGVIGTHKSVPEPHLVRRIHRMLDEGRRVVIFPEGGRRWDGRPAPWIAATAKLFWRMGVPVYPVRIHGSYVSWPRWARWPRPARVTVQPLPAIDFTGCQTLQHALDRLKEPISECEDAPGGSHGCAPAWSYRPADGFNRLAYRCPTTGAFNAVRSPDGRRIEDGAGVARWTMQHDSTLVDANGDVVPSGDFREIARRMPLSPEGNGALIRHDAWVRTNGLQSGRAELYTDRVRLGDFTIPVEKIRYMGLERSDRIWLVDNERHVYSRFPDSCSTLAWYDTLLRINPEINA